MIGIYKITSPNGRVYIGQSIDIDKRFWEYSLLHNCSNQIRLYNSLKKYGPETHIFDLIEECKINELNDRERFYQDKYNVMGKSGLNCRLTTSNTKSGKNSIKSNKKRSKTLCGQKRGPRPDVSKRNKIVHKGKTISEEHKKAISKFFKGKPHPYQGPRGVSLRKPVLQYSKDKSILIKEHESIQAAARAIDRGAGDIHRVISGKGKSCAGFWWRYK
jgi:group I intron endonuclease